MALRVNAPHKQKIARQQTIEKAGIVVCQHDHAFAACQMQRPSQKLLQQSATSAACAGTQEQQA